MSWYKRASLELYHGTSGTHDSFDLSYSGTRDFGDWGTGIYLTNSPTLARMYASNMAARRGGEPVVLLVRVNTDKFVYLDDPKYQDILKMEKYVTEDYRQTRRQEESMSIRDRFMGEGFDGAVKGKGVLEFVVYDPSKLQVIERISLQDALGALSKNYAHPEYGLLT